MQYVANVPSKRTYCHCDNDGITPINLIGKLSDEVHAIYKFLLSLVRFMILK